MYILLEDKRYYRYFILHRLIGWMIIPHA